MMEVKERLDLKIKHLTELQEVERGNLIFKDQEKNPNYRESFAGRVNSPGLGGCGMKRSDDS